MSTPSNHATAQLKRWRRRQPNRWARTAAAAAGAGAYWSAAAAEADPSLTWVRLSRSAEDGLLPAPLAALGGRQGFKIYRVGSAASAPTAVPASSMSGHRFCARVYRGYLKWHRSTPIHRRIKLSLDSSRGRTLHVSSAGLGQPIVLLSCRGQLENLLYLQGVLSFSQSRPALRPVP